NSVINAPDKVSLDSNNIELVFNVKEGNPTYIEKLIFSDIDSIKQAEYADNFAFLEDGIFNKIEFENTLSEMLDYFEEQGSPFAAIKIENLFFRFDSVQESNLVDIKLSFTEIIPSRIGKISIIGNEKTKDFVIERSIRIQPGELYSQSKFDNIPKQLNRLRFFEPVESPLFYLDNKNDGVIQITVKEKETNSFDGILGYVPEATGNKKGYFTGFVNVGLRNIFGTGRAASIKWNKEASATQELELKYLEPWIFGYPFNVEGGYYQRKQDSTYVQNKFNFNVEFLASNDITASFLFSRETIIPTEPDKRGFTVYYSTATETGLNLKIDTRDDVYAPTEGLLFINAYKFSSKKINGPEEFITSSTKRKIGLQRLELDFSYFYEIVKRQIAMLGVHARELKSSLFEISDYYKLGGTNSLRGFRENQFLGNRILWSNMEYRYLMAQRSFGFLFFDTGYYLKEADPENDIKKNLHLKSVLDLVSVWKRVWE
ncbi:BamA/TamA family outer membrane protein, partial [Patescibacteria group bacterium]|nr:BamA/TamA family outer membrane protein [Patescibacteria group bacterium]